MFVTPYQVAETKERAECNCKNDRGQDRMQLEQQLSEIISAKPERGGPQDCPCCVGNKESRPRHVVHSGQKRREDTQQGHETTEEDNLPFMLAEEVLADFDTSNRHANVPAVAQKDLI